MKIERERGISVSASAMTFDHAGLMFNLLDTPGHEDFSEDTYRTLTAADAAIMVLDAAKGIEAQTLKLFEVCRLRDIPIVTFINKMDREALDPFELLDEIATKLQLDPAPLYWPAGSGGRFKGMMDLRGQRFLPFAKKSSDKTEGHPDAIAFKSNAISRFLDPDEQGEVEEGAMLVQEAAKPFDPVSFLEGHMTPIFFGSALRHFGVDQLLEGIGAYAPPPKPVAAIRSGDATHVAPGDNEVTGFVFKVQANMDPNHRDRVAVPAALLGRVQTRHEAEGPEHRPSAFGQRADHVLRLRPRTGRGRLRRRRDRHSQPRRAAGGRQSVGNRNAAFCRPAQLRPGNPAPGAGRKVDPRSRPSTLKKALEGLAEEGVTQLFRPIIGSDFYRRLASSASCSSRSWPTGLAGEYELDVIFEAAPYRPEARWLGERGRRHRGLQRQIPHRPWPRISTARRSTWPSRPGTSKLRRRGALPGKVSFLRDAGAGVAHCNMCPWFETGSTPHQGRRKSDWAAK